MPDRPAQTAAAERRQALPPGRCPGFVQKEQVMIRLFQPGQGTCGTVAGEGMRRCSAASAGKPSERQADTGALSAALALPNLR